MKSKFKFRILEYSALQNEYHISSLEDVIRHNIFSFSRGYDPGYLPVAVIPEDHTPQILDKVVSEFEALVFESGEGGPES